MHLLLIGITSSRLIHILILEPTIILINYILNITVKIQYIIITAIVYEKVINCNLILSYFLYLKKKFDIKN